MTQEEKVAIRKSILPAEMSRGKATYLLQTVWPGASQEAITRAALICAQYQLNPLLKHIALLRFTNKRTGKDVWEPVLEIKASRIIAHRNHIFTYEDGPRMMTDIEEKAIFGEVYSDRLCAIVKLKDNLGNIFPGYGFWLKGDEPYGQDKGNTKANMAFIRAERNALDKMAPGELPEVELAESTYIEGDFTEIIEQGKKDFIKSTEKQIAEGWPETKEQPESRPIGTEESKTELPGEAKTVPISKAPLSDSVDSTWLKETLDIIRWTDKTTLSWLKAQVKADVSSGKLNEVIASLSPESCKKFVGHITLMRESAGK